MKRDWDVVREILTKVESMDLYNQELSLKSFETKTAKELFIISGHMKLLIERELVNGVMYSQLNIRLYIDDFSVKGLTWAGHEFLDSIRNDTVWNKTKETFTTKGLDMTFETIKAVAAAAMTSMLGLSA